MLTAIAGPPVLSPAAMRAAEDRAIAAGTPAALLMERAGAAAALAIRRMVAPVATTILCGPGNNGGDGYVVARHLRAAGWAVKVSGIAPASPLAIDMAARWDGPWVPLAEASPAGLVVDALFGTGMTRPLDAGVQAVLDELRHSARAVVALDCPSGIDMATGEALGQPLAAGLTIAFGALKTGNVIGDGYALAGRLAVADIGLGDVASDLRRVDPPRRSTAAPALHKFARGHALVIEGPAAAGGAARLTARAALRAGAGVVTLVGPDAASPVDAIMCRRDHEGRVLLDDKRTTAVVIGPGLADDDRAHEWLRTLLGGTVPLVLDAGALSLCSGRVEALAEAAAPLVLTPHDGEFARLFGPVGSDRVAAARAAAVKAQAVVVLKGPQTVIAAPDGRAAINVHAAPWLATAGSGDVLAGIIGSQLAQGCPPFDAATIGVWLHGDCGVRGGPGLIADDLPELLPSVLAAL